MTVSSFFHGSLRLWEQLDSTCSCICLLCSVAKRTPRLWPSFRTGSSRGHCFCSLFRRSLQGWPVEGACGVARGISLQVALHRLCQSNIPPKRRRDVSALLKFPPHLVHFAADVRLRGLAAPRAGRDLCAWMLSTRLGAQCLVSLLNSLPACWPHLCAELLLCCYGVT